MNLLATGRGFMTGWVASLAAALAVAFCPAAWADTAQTLRDFVRETRSGRSPFTQTVTSPDGARKKVSSGTFEFLRPNRFRFQYTRPFVQLIVADGNLVWIHDPDLNQVSSRRIAAALGATPAALLAGGAIEREFELVSQPPGEGLDWVLALPRQKDGVVQSVRVGFRGKDLAALEIVDSFGQRSLLQFTAFQANAVLAAEVFVFTPPAGADVIEQ